MKIPQCAPRLNYVVNRKAIDSAVNRVLNSGWYILGPEVAAFEQEYAAWCGCDGMVGVANGTDALELALRSLELPDNARVAVPSHTASATGIAILRAGLIPFFVDIDERTYNISPKRLSEIIRENSNIAAIVVVHLYGAPAEMGKIMPLADANGIPVIEDCAQAHGASIFGRKVGTFGKCGTFSFYPTKNLGGIGDGGAVISSDPILLRRLQLLRQYGWARRFSCEAYGVNSRLDELQAAILRVKLKTLDHDNQQRRRIAAYYLKQLRGLPIILPFSLSKHVHVYHQFVIRTSARNELQQYLAEQGIGTAVHYPEMLHQQRLFIPYDPGGLRTFNDILSLPIFPEMSLEAADYVTAKIKAFFQ